MDQILKSSTLSLCQIIAMHVPKANKNFVKKNFSIGSFSTLLKKSVKGTTLVLPAAWSPIGDSKSYSRIKHADAPLCDGEEIARLECRDHVQKCMGRQLTNK